VSPTEELAALFAQHGIRVLRRDEWLVPDGTIGPYVRTFLAPHDEESNGASVRLDVEVAVSDKYCVVESFAGIGTSTAQAVSNAFENFCKSLISRHSWCFLRSLRSRTGRRGKVELVWSGLRRTDRKLHRP
jgi:hypothetical protein